MYCDYKDVGLAIANKLDVHLRLAVPEFVEYMDRAIVHEREDYRIYIWEIDEWNCDEDVPAIRAMINLLREHDYESANLSECLFQYMELSDNGDNGAHFLSFGNVQYGLITKIAIWEPENGTKQTV
jgi:hypothetical protein